MIRQLYLWIGQQRGWRGASVDFALGAIASLALLPSGFLPALLAFVPAFLRIAQAANGWSAFITGWMISTGWFSLSLYWISHSLFIGEAAFLFMLPFSAFGLPLLLGLFWGIASFISFRLSRTVSGRLIWLAFSLGLAELARGTMFTGLPWNAPGQVFLALDMTSQAGAFIGQYGLNFALFSGLVAIALIPQDRRLAGIISLPVICLCLLSGWRAVSMPGLETILEDRPVVRLVQPNISQAEKWDRQVRLLHLDKLASLSREIYPLPQLIIWPETAIAGALPRDLNLLTASARNAAAFDGMLLTGTLRFDEKHNLYNSAILASATGEILAQTDKEHLVPFGEYVPFRWLPFVDAIAGPIDFKSGSSTHFDTDLYGRLEILICYEVIFPGFIAKRPRPSALINLTNDAWFGHTAGPYQHLAQARARAIEEGLPLMRVANTGITAGIDPYGRIIKILGLGKSGAIDVGLPAPLAPTFYAKYRRAGVVIFCLWLIGIGFWVDRRGQNLHKV